MKKQLRTNPAIKVLAVILVLITMAGGFWATIFTLSQWDDIWTGGDYFNSSGYSHRLYDRTMQVQNLVTLMQDRQWDSGKLSYTNQRWLEQLQYDTISLGRDSSERRNDYVLWDEEKEWSELHIFLSSQEVLICTPENAEEAAPYGWLLQDNIDWGYNSYADTRNLRRELALEYGVLSHMTVQDEFLEGRIEYNEYAKYLPHIALASLAADIVCFLFLVFLCLGAGRRRNREGIVLRAFDYIPLEIVAVLEFFAWAILLNAGDSITWSLNHGMIAPDTVVGLGVISLGGAGCVLLAVLTLAVRAKAGTLGTNTLTWIIGKAIARGVQDASQTWPLTGRVVGLFLLYLLGTFLTAFTIFLIPVYQGLVLWALCRWTIQWKKVRSGTAQIVGGNPNAKIDTHKMYRDLAEHAGQLNDLGSAISTAVDERMQSERFKTELITNVSHDLKTPLTSIINYVDLLKKEDIQNEKAAEYLEVLDRKSQRLKKLTEDLVEASKASTGTLAVHPERLGVVQLVQQALGEFEDKFSQHRLEPVLTVQDGEVYVRADGRHLWRVIDNLLSNCNKYAMEGTRVYVDVAQWESRVVLTVKNISKAALNIPADQLMERFVRGDEARTTEGSGLGLSIARSLTELQGGEFRLDIDGDLFKASVSFPAAPAPAPADELLKTEKV